MPPTITEQLSLLETMLKDTAAGKATETELRREYLDKVKGIDETIKGLGLTDEAIKAQLAEIEKQQLDLKAIIKRQIAASPGDTCVANNAHKAKAFGYFLLGALGLKSYQKKYEDLTGEAIQPYQSKDMEESTGSAGGYLVPDDFRREIINLMNSYGDYRPNVMVWPMSSNGSTCPKLTQRLTVYCVGHGASPTPSDLAFAQLRVIVQKWMTLTLIDSELDEDSAIALAPLLMDMIAESFAYQEDLCGFNGDGTSAYFGIMGLIAALLAVDATPANIKGVRVQGTAGAWSAITLDDLLATTACMPSKFDDANAKYYCHRAFYLTVMVAKALAAGGSPAAEVIQTGYSRNPTFLGRTVVNPHCMYSTKPAADHVPLLFANLKRGAVLGDRRKLTVDRSTEYGFGTDQLTVRGSQRIGMNNHGVGDTTNAGPVCGLLADIV